MRAGMLSSLISYRPKKRAKGQGSSSARSPFATHQRDGSSGHPYAAPELTVHEERESGETEGAGSSRSQETAHMLSSPVAKLSLDLSNSPLAEHFPDHLWNERRELEQDGNTEDEASVVSTSEEVVANLEAMTVRAPLSPCYMR